VTTAELRLPDEVTSELERTSWLDLACVLLVLGGAVNVIVGISTVSDSRYVSGQVLFSNVHAWGWVFLVWGVVQILAGLAVYRGARWGAVVAIASAGLNAVAQFASAQNTPIWSLTLVALDVFVIYGLVAKAGVFARRA